MAKEFLMGNQAIALGAIRAGVSLAAGYPGTPVSYTHLDVYKRQSYPMENGGGTGLHRLFYGHFRCHTDFSGYH